MLRLRLPEPLPAALPPPAGGALPPFALEVWATNESGSIVKPAQPLTLKLTAVDAITLQPLGGAKVDARPAGSGAAASSGGGKKAVVAAPTVGLTGTAKLDVVVSGLPPSSLFRLRVEAAKPATLKPLYASFDGGGGGSGAKSLPVEEVTLAVSAVYSAAVAVGPVKVAAAKAPHSGATTTADPLACQLLSFAHCGRELRVHEQQMAIAPGFGSIAWDCAFLLATFLEANPALLKGRRAVDIGTGTGLVALAAANVGAHVVATDLTDLLPLTAVNVAANAHALRAGGGTVTCAPLPWGLDAGTASLAQLLSSPLVDDDGSACSGVGATVYPAAAVGGTAALARLQPPLLQQHHPDDNTAAPVFLPPYDVILASEVAYRTEIFPLLVATLRSLCRAPAGDGDAGVGAARATGGCAPLILLAARQRACCELSEFLALLAEHFHVVLLAGEPSAAALPEGVARLPAAAAPPGAAAAGKGGKSGGAKAKQPPQDSATSPFAALTLPPAVGRFAAGAAALSKTAWAPLLFGLTPK